MENLHFNFNLLIVSTDSAQKSSSIRNNSTREAQYERKMGDALAETGNVTIIITTSPIPSNPSTKMLSQVLESLSHSPYLNTCPIILVFDGFTLNENSTQFKSSKISGDQSKSYNEFRSAVHELLSGSKDPPQSETTYEEKVGLNINSTVTQRIFSSKLQTLSQSVRVGFALAIRSALFQVNTPYILIVQHDWAFRRSIPIENLLCILDNDTEVNYIGFVSRQTLDYANRKSNRAPSITSEVIIKYNEPFTRLFFWYDKPHLARAEYYRTQVFGHKRFKRGDFIEDTFGHTVLSESKAGGIESWKKYACWLWYPDNGLIPTIRHLNGRKFYDEPGYWTKNEVGIWYYRTEISPCPYP